MSETINQEIKTEAAAEETTEIAEEVIEKPYKFRKLGSKDVFLMFTIISKIGINEFMACMESASLKSLVKKLTSKEETEEDVYFMGAVAGTLEIANVIFANLHKCEKEIYQLLCDRYGVDPGLPLQDRRAIVGVRYYLEEKDFSSYICSFYFCSMLFLRFLRKMRRRAPCKSR